MLALKEKRKKEAAEASSNKEDGNNNEEQGKKVSLLGVGGKATRKTEGSKKRTPGEIRIQKGECLISLSSFPYYIQWLVIPLDVF